MYERLLPWARELLDAAGIALRDVEVIAFVAERFNRTIKEQAIHGHLFRDIEDVRQAVNAFRGRYNRHWCLEKLG